MSLKRNIVASYATQIYVALVGIVIVPLYISYMGAEAYGLVGFFAMLQAWFALLDIGLTPTIGRETARFHGGALTAEAYRQLYRSLALIFLVIAITGGFSIWLAADWIALRWLNTTELSPDDVVLSLQIMAICVALRWVGGLYRGVITGFERLVWLSVFNVIVATLRFVGAFPIMWIFGFTPFVFFLYQLTVAMIETVSLVLKSHHLLPYRRGMVESVTWSLRPIRPLLRFTLTIAFTSSVWVLVTQTDKLVLSGILPLAEYGYFTLAVLVANAVTLVSSPISMAIMPRMARLHAEGRSAEIIQVYRTSTQLVSIVAGSLSLTFAFCADKLLFAWTGDLQVAEKAAPILALYAIGNGLLALGGFPYYLQYAKGNLRYHLISNLVMVIILLPAIILVASRYGGVGAGLVWVAVNGTYLLTWVAYIHHKLEPGLHMRWLSRDILKILLPIGVAAIFASFFSYDATTRTENFLYVLIFGILMLVTASIFSPFFRNYVARKTAL